jgi:hypothetical protein
MSEHSIRSRQCGSSSSLQAGSGKEFYRLYPKITPTFFDQKRSARPSY